MSNNLFHARVEREEGWWIIQLREDPALLSQARRLDQVVDVVRDALELFPELTDAPHLAEVDVEVVVDFAALEELKEAQRSAKEAQAKANSLAAETSAQLHAAGLSYRDVGYLMGITHGRAQQLATSQR